MSANTSSKIKTMTITEFLRDLLGDDYNVFAAYKLYQVLENKWDLLHFFDVCKGNPNGDPDAGNLPRTDIDTGVGLVTDVCIKRKIRDYVDLTMDGADGYKMYIKNDAFLNQKDEAALIATGLLSEGVKDAKKRTEEIKRKIKEGKANDEDLEKALLEYMQRTYYDVRTFGAVMTSFTKEGMSCGHARGPVQFTCASSIDPVTINELSITRVVQANATKPENPKKSAKAADDDESAEEKENTKNGTFGDKFIIPYALYRMEGHISAMLAQRNTGFTEDDFGKLVYAMMNMFDEDRSATRGEMSTKELILFKHDSPYGNAPAWKLYDAVTVTKLTDNEPTGFGDYRITVDENKIPDGVTCYRIR